jgi:hypothetical protein
MKDKRTKKNLSLVKSSRSIDPFGPTASRGDLFFSKLKQTLKGLSQATAEMKLYLESAEFEKKLDDLILRNATLSRINLEAYDSRQVRIRVKLGILGAEYGKRVAFASKAGAMTGRFFGPKGAGIGASIGGGSQLVLILGELGNVLSAESEDWGPDPNQKH